MIRVLHVIGGTEIGGTELVLERLVAGLEDRDISCDVVSLRPLGPVGIRMAEAGHRVRSLDVRSAGSAVTALPRLVGEIRTNRPDVVQTWIYHADLLGGLAARVARHRAVAWSVRQGEVSRERNRRTVRWLARSCGALDAALARRVVFNSSDSIDAHVRLGYRRSSAVLIPNGFDVEQFRPDPARRERARRELGVTAESPVVGIVARWDRQKDHRTFLQAAQRILERVPSTVFAMVGPGIDPSNAQLADLLDDVGLRPPALRLLGARTDVAALLAAFDVAVSSSAGEGFPNAVGEAMATARYCVATDVGDTAALVGDAGVLVPPGDPHALAVAVVSAIEGGPVTRDAVGAGARQRIESLFSLDRMVDRYADLYRDLANEGDR